MRKKVLKVLAAVLTASVVLGTGVTAASAEGRTTAVFADTQCPTSLSPADSWI